jgi:hypothetical protein
MEVDTVDMVDMGKLNDYTYALYQADIALKNGSKVS